MNAMSDRDVLEKLIVVTPSRKIRGDPGGKLDTSSSRLIADGLAMYEQELAAVSAGGGMRVEAWGGAGRGRGGGGAGCQGNMAGVRKGFVSAMASENHGGGQGRSWNGRWSMGWGAGDG